MENLQDIKDKVQRLQYASLGLAGISKVLEEMDIAPEVEPGPNTVNFEDPRYVSIKLHHAMAAISDHITWLAEDVEYAIRRKGETS